MAVCTTCFESGIIDPHDCPGPQYADIVFTRHQGRGITIDHAPARTRIAPQVLADRYTYLHMPQPDQIVFADQVVYRITGYDPAASALTLELVEDWRPAPEAEPGEGDEPPAPLTPVAVIPVEPSEDQT